LAHGNIQIVGTEYDQKAGISLLMNSAEPVSASDLVVATNSVESVSASDLVVTINSAESVFRKRRQLKLLSRY
jgi:hypothetical protein